MNVETSAGLYLSVFPASITQSFSTQGWEFSSLSLS